MIKSLVLVFVIGLCSGAEEIQSNSYLGYSIDIFKFFGDLSMRLRTTPRNDSANIWLFRDQLTKVFTFSDNIVSINNKTRVSLKTELCDDISELYSAYFRGIKVEGLDNTWTGFSGSWTTNLASKKLGVSESFIKPNFSYLLVMIDWYNEQANLNKSQLIGLTEKAENVSNQLTPSNIVSVNNFIREIGSHFISSYVTGEGLFQVFVFNENSYKELKLMMISPNINIKSVLNTFCSHYAKSIGRIMVRSGDTSLTHWVRRKFRREPTRSLSYAPSLFEIYREPRLLIALRKRIRNRVIMKLNLEILDSIFNDKVNKQWFREVVDNRLKLYGLNI